MAEEKKEETTVEVPKKFQKLVEEIETMSHENLLSELDEAQDKIEYWLKLRHYAHVVFNWGRFHGDLRFNSTNKTLSFEERGTMGLSYIAAKLQACKRVCRAIADEVDADWITCRAAQPDQPGYRY